MATLNHSTIIKGFESLINERDGDGFFFAFLKVFKFATATIKRLKEPGNNRNVAPVPGDYALVKQIFFHPAKPGEDLQASLQRAVNDPALQKHRIRFFLTTDFENVVAYDRRVDDWVSFAFKDLRENYEFFLPLTGLYEKPLAYTAHPADVKACEKMGRLYDVIRELNHYDSTNLHDLNVFLTRLLFCFFAEDTGIFPKEGQMTAAIEALTKADGSDLASFFERLFWILDLSPDRLAREQETPILAAFPYVNGGLFREKIHIPTFDAKARNILLECGRLEWNQISPVIFGAMFQSVMNPEARRELGAHYTSEKNIFKVIGPLFLDDLRAEFEKLASDKSTHRVKRLRDFQVKLASLKFLDPACGCGNFLIVTYREIKRLELEVVKQIYSADHQMNQSIFDDWLKDVSLVSINQFYGIELEEFPVDVARVSMWLMEHVMNREFGNYFGHSFPLIPLRSAANISVGNALQIGWDEIAPMHEVSFIFWNPPFVGRPSRTLQQQEDLSRWVCEIKDGANLDYVCAWYLCASYWMKRYPRIKAAFVSTNSICQGEQVVPLWKGLIEGGVYINFAHQTFKWSNEARGAAAVYCIVVGFSRKNEVKGIFAYQTPTSDPTFRSVAKINPLLIEASPEIFVEPRKEPFHGDVSPMMLGNQPTDNGNLLVEESEAKEFLKDDAISPYIKRFLGAREFLHGIPRYCLWLVGAPQSVLNNGRISARVSACRQFRLASKKIATKRDAAIAHLFQDRRFDFPPTSSMVVPCHSSVNRVYIPIGFVGSDVIVGNANLTVPNATLFEFGVMESYMHMTWMRTVCGRLKGDYRYSRDLCYNTFPWPKVSDAQKKIIENLAQNVILAREFHPEMALADLYDPSKMPEDLNMAHKELDLAVDRLYRKKPFTSDDDRLQHLFARYERLVKKEDDASLFYEE